MPTLTLSTHNTLKTELGAKPIPINQSSFTVGRHGHFKTPHYDNSISRLQCAVLQVRKSYYVRDLNSANGTRVNGTDIGKREVVLFDGDEIGMGIHGVSIIFRKGGDS